MDERKVHDLSIRRREQLQDDPVMQLADRILKEVVGALDTVDAAGQLVALELATRATTQAIGHSLGDVGLSQVMVEFDHRRRTYHLQWPEHDQTKTVYEDKQDALSSDADVVLLKKDDDA